METINNLPVPPWDMESAAARLQLLENDFNTLDPEKISANYIPKAEARFGTEFLTGQEEIKKYIGGYLAPKIKYRLTLHLWGALKGRMAVHYEADWTDAYDKQFKTYGVQVFQFNSDGLIETNFTGFNDQEIL